MKNLKYKSHNELKKVLYGVLLFCLIVWLVVYISINYKNEKEIFIQYSPLHSNTLSPQQRQQAISELKEVVSKSPPLTDKERAKAIAELKKTIANQKK